MARREARSLREILQAVTNELDMARLRIRELEAIADKGSTTTVQPEEPSHAADNKARASVYVAVRQPIKVVVLLLFVSVAAIPAFVDRF